MNILRPLSPHLSRVFKRFYIAFIILGVLYFLLSLLFLQLGLIPYFWVLLSKAGILFASKSIPSLLLKVGCSSTLAFMIVLALRATITGLDAESIKMMAHSGSSGSWTYLYFPSTSTEGTSVNQPAAGSVHPGNAVASTEEAASPARPDPFPYQPDEVIGGDSVLSIQRRLLSRYVFPSAEIIERARIEAEDLFEVKVDIIRRMTPLDPEGDWLGRGARAFDNPRTSTGEESLERLYRLLDDLNQGGVESSAFRSLRGRVFRRRNALDEHSET